MKKAKNISLVQSFILVAAVAGMAGPLSKYALQDIPVFGYTFVRLLASALIMLIVLWLMKKPPSRKNFVLFAPVATFWWLNALVFTAGLQHTNATTAQFIHICIPAITALIAYAVLRERLNNKQWLGSLVAIIGVGIVVVSGGTLSFTNSAFLGNILIALSAVVFSIYAVFSKKAKYGHIRPVEMIFIASLCGVVVSLPLALIEYQNNQWLGAASGLSLLAMLVGVTAISIFYVGFQSLIRKYGASIATTNLYLLPIAVIVWSFIILREVVSLPDAIGAVVAIIGVTIFSLATPKNRKLKGI